ncbi:hypothetical protein I3760_02G010000 [Carya illinoinensis]|nr:hypothetical protein I3760_02G010000 [Carya illinoinensis]
MANASRTSTATRTCLFFLMIIFCHELLSIEARNVEPKKKYLRCAGCSRPDTKGIASTQPRKFVASPSHLHLDGTKTTTIIGFVEAFRPTSPGHSPGVGHSIHN